MGLGTLDTAADAAVIARAQTRKSRGRVPVVAGAAVALCCVLSACGNEQVEPGRAAAGLSTPIANPSALRAPSPSAVTARASCRHQTPGEVRARFLPQARRLRADASLLKLATRPPKRLRSASSSTSLAAAVYAVTRPAAERPHAFAACRTELRRFTAKKGSS